MQPQHLELLNSGDDMDTHIQLACLRKLSIFIEELTQQMRFTMCI